MKKRSENRGFTLVEIIIAVAILAIAISPLVANFIQSSKLNLKGRKSLNAMNLAQDMMEGMSGFTAEEVSGIIDGAVVSGNSLAGSILPSLASHGAVAKTSPAADEKLVYTLNDVKAAPGASALYDVILTLDPTGTEQAEFNGKDMANISEMDQYYDAVYTCPISEIDEAITELRSKASDLSIPVESYRGKIIRTIKVVIANAGDATNPDYSVNVIREYKVTPEFANNVGLVGESWTTPATNILKAPVTQKPRSVYLYYQGIDGASVLAASKMDNIVVESTIGEEITVYLLRQARQTGTQAENSAYESSYTCDVKVKAKDMTGLDTTDVHIVSNIRYDLSQPIMAYNFRDKKEDGTAIAPADIEYPLSHDGELKKLEDITNSDYVTTSTYKKARADYYYNSDIQLIDEAMYQSNFTAGYTKEEKNTLYKVLIEVYEASDSERIAHYNGGLSN